jgi:CRISPR-associated endoribonuclease Cas6
MLVSLIVQLRPVKKGSLPSVTGPAIHALFFNWLAAYNQSLSDELHSLQTLKPFAVSGLQRGSGDIELAPTPPEINLYPDRLYWFRITSLDERLSELLLKRFCVYPPNQIQLLDRPFIVEKVSAEPADHPWCAVSSWQELSRAVPAAGREQRTTLLFHSPTTFKGAGRSFPVPLPEQTFGSLASRWNMFSSEPLAPVYSPERIAQVAISGYELKSEIALLEGSNRGVKLLGFRGWCEYTVFGDKETAIMLYRLARLAFFCGVGYKTTMGFGQTLSADGHPRSHP